MSLNPKELVKDKKYVIWITGIIREFVAECVGHDDRQGWGKIKILNPSSSWYGEILIREDYVPLEEYDEKKHGPIV